MYTPKAQLLYGNMQNIIFSARKYESLYIPCTHPLVVSNNTPHFPAGANIEVCDYVIPNHAVLRHGHWGPTPTPLTYETPTNENLIIDIKHMKSGINLTSRCFIRTATTTFTNTNCAMRTNTTKKTGAIMGLTQQLRVQSSSALQSSRNASWK